MNQTVAQSSARYEEAAASIDHALEKMKGCRDEEKRELRRDIADLQGMAQKLTQGRVEIAVFGEISTGKSALINALVGEAVTEVDVQGGWTKEVWDVDWEGCGYCVPGLADSKVVLIDTPGLNEVGGGDRADMARDAAQRADLILFVTDSDLNETEFSALAALTLVHKPIIVVFNKIDLYTPEERERLLQVLRDDRLTGAIQPENVVMAAAHPREMEYVVEDQRGRTKSEWRRPEPILEDLRVRILEVLEQDGLALLALNAAMYAADKSDRVTALRMRLREKQATKLIWSYAAVKSLTVAFTPPAVDVIGGSAVDLVMVANLAKIYGLDLSWKHSRKLFFSILKAGGWVAVANIATLAAGSLFKAVTFGFGAVLTALPQGAAAGYGSYIVGRAAKYFFEHGSTWGGESPKIVIKRILAETDKNSVLNHLKDEIRGKILRNRHTEAE